MFFVRLIVIYIGVPVASFSIYSMQEYKEDWTRIWVVLVLSLVAYGLAKAIQKLAFQRKGEQGH